MKKLLTILTLALALCLLCSAAMAEIRYVATIQIDQNDDGTTPVTIKIPSNKVSIRNVEYTVTGISFDRNSGYVDAATGLTVAQTKENCEKEIVVYVRYDAKDGSEGYEGYNLIPVRHIWVQQEPHTQTEATYKCKVCGATKKDAPIHAYEQVIVVAPTCEEDGLATMMCSCGKTKDDGYAIQGGHQWVKSESAPECVWNKAPADWKKGSVSWKCAYCGQYLKNFTAATLIADPEWAPDQVEVDSNPNTWVSKTAYSASFTVADWAQYKNDTEFDGHNWSEWKYISATCNRAGYKVRWCVRCDKNEIKALEATDGLFYEQNKEYLGPQWVVVQNVENLICTYTDAANYGYDKDVYIVCARCNGSVEGHILKKAGTDYSYEYYEKTEDFNASTKKTAKNKVTGLINTNLKTNAVSVVFTIAGDDAATLTANAAHVYEYKSAYAKKYTTYTFGAQDDSDLAGFTIVVNGTHVPATCTNKGFVDYFCKYDALKDGSHAMKRVWDDPAPGHKFGAWVTEFDPTETEPTGWYHRKCEVCNYGEVSHATGKPCDVHEPINVETKAATCTEEGTYETVCKNCGAKLELDGDGKIAKIAHTWEEDVITPATCAKKGVMLKTCSVCKAMEKEDIPVIPHTWDEGKITKEATKDAKGVKTYTCTVCKETKTEEVDYVVTKKAAYTLEDVALNGDIVTGKLVHVEDTKEADQKGIRVTFYNGNTYITVAAQLYADGSFEAQGAGAVEHITIAAYATEKVVNPAGLNEDNWFGSKSIDVK